MQLGNPTNHLGRLVLVVGMVVVVGLAVVVLSCVGVDVDDVGSRIDVGCSFPLEDDGYLPFLCMDCG